MTALIPAEVTIGHDSVRVDVVLLGEPTGNSDLVVVPHVSGWREYDNWDDPVAFTGWTVLHKPSRRPVVGVSFTLDDARHFARRLAHLNWAHVTREQDRGSGHPYHATVRDALKEVAWW